jgi:hypothetical protein
MKGLSLETGRNWVTILVNMIIVIMTEFWKMSLMGACLGRAKAKTHMKEMRMPGRRTMVSIMPPLRTMSISKMIWEYVPEVYFYVYSRLLRF